MEGKGEGAKLLQNTQEELPVWPTQRPHLAYAGPDARDSVCIVDW